MWVAVCAANLTQTVPKERERKEEKRIQLFNIQLLNDFKIALVIAVITSSLSLVHKTHWRYKTSLLSLSLTLVSAHTLDGIGHPPPFPHTPTAAHHAIHSMIVWWLYMYFILHQTIVHKQFIRIFIGILLNIHYFDFCCGTMWRLEARLLFFHYNLLANLALYAFVCVYIFA